MSKFEFIKLYISLFRIDLGLQMVGFERLFNRHVKRYPLPSASEQELNETLDGASDEINKLLNSIDYVCTVYPRSAQCMHRSFLGYQYLRKKFHLPVELVIGVRKMPFTAHAWLMLDGQNVNEDPEYTDQFQIILSTEGGSI